MCNTAMAQVQEKVSCSQPLLYKCSSEHVGGVCCIDEFDGIREADKVSIHEVMEQQTLSIAKAGLVTSLSTRTSVFGAMNPRGNPKDSVAEQTLLSGPLLSRFDILLPVHDPKSAEADEIMSEHILINHQLHRSSEPKVRHTPQTLCIFIAADILLRG